MSGQPDFSSWTKEPHLGVGTIECLTYGDPNGSKKEREKLGYEAFEWWLQCASKISNKWPKKQQDQALAACKTGEGVIIKTGKFCHPAVDFSQYREGTYDEHMDWWNWTPGYRCPKGYAPWTIKDETGAGCKAICYGSRGNPTNGIPCQELAPVPVLPNVWQSDDLLPLPQDNPSGLMDITPSDAGFNWVTPINGTVTGGDVTELYNFASMFDITQEYAEWFLLSLIPAAVFSYQKETIGFFLAYAALGLLGPIIVKKISALISRVLGLGLDEAHGWEKWITSEDGLLIIVGVGESVTLLGLIIILNRLKIVPDSVLGYMFLGGLGVIAFSELAVWWSFFSIEGLIKDIGDIGDDAGKGVWGIVKHIF